MQLVFAENVVRKTNKRILIATPLAVSDQTVREGEKFGIECKRSKAGKLPGSKIVVTNYESLHKFDPNDFIGMAADESACLKSFDSVTKALVTEFMRRLPYRSLYSATPAPNDFIELGTSSEALGELGYMDMLGRFFKNDQNSLHPTSGRGRFERGALTQNKWRFKKHAEEPFWKWICSWARACRKPSDLGFDDGLFTLPPLTERLTVVKSSKPLPGFLFEMPAVGLKEQREELRHTLKERCEAAASKVEGNAPAVLWCHLNAEGDLLESIIPGGRQISGSQSDDEKEELFRAFSSGQLKKLVIKPKIGAWGLNWQHCARMTFFPSHCYDEITEVLTKRGWLSFGQVSFTDEVGTVNPETSAFEWQHPTDIVWDKYSGPMIHFGPTDTYAKGFDLLVTPNHRMVVRRDPARYPGSDGKWIIKTAGWLESHYKRLEYQMLSAPKSFDGVKLTEICIPAYTRREPGFTGPYNKRGDKRGTAKASLKALQSGRLIVVPSLPIDTFIKLAGWYITEGNCGYHNGKNDGQIRICQTDINPEYRKEIIDLLDSIPGLSVNSKTKDIGCSSMQLATFLVDQFGHGSYNKKIPSWVKELSVEHLIMLRDTMLKGDGGSHKKGGQKWYYRTVSKQLADDFSEICLKTGLRASVHYRQFNTGRYAGYGVYDVNIARKNLTPSIHQKPSTIEYTGMIGCVSVPNGTLIVRRNGIPVVSGNSFEQWYQAVRRCWRFGQQHEVVVDVITTEGQKDVLLNLQRKAKAADEMFNALIRLMHEASGIKRNELIQPEVVLPQWLSK